MAARGRSGDKTYTKDVPSSALALATRDARHVSATSVQDRLVGPSAAEMLRSIQNSACPFCGKRMKNIASHTNRTHGVGKFELKKMAGIPKTKPACSPEFTAERSVAAKSNVDAGHIRKMLTAPRKNKREYSDAGKAVQRAKLGHPNVVAARRLGFSAVSPDQAREYARRAGETNTRRRRAQTADRDRQIVQRVQSGELLEDVALSLGIHTRTAKKALVYAGIHEDLRTHAAKHEQRRTKSRISLANAKAQRKKNLEAIRDERCRRWIDLGGNWEAISILADEWKRSRRSVAAYLRRSGMQVPDGRSRGGA